MQLKLNQICTNGGTQPREAIDEQIVAEYAELYKAGVKLPPVVVFADGAAHWLADGFHRHWARNRNGDADIEADVHKGTKRDAILYSVGANAAHGMRRTNADKRKAVMTLLEDDEWGKWSNMEVARQCVVDEGTVRKYRDLLSSELPKIAATRKVSRGGTTYEQDTTNIGRRVVTKDEYESGGEESEVPEDVPRVLGKGVQYAMEAICALKKIAYDDKLRSEGFRMVRQWLDEHN